VIQINERGQRKNLYFDDPYKHSLVVRDAHDIDAGVLCVDDQVKLTIEIPREEAVEWQRIKAEILTACKEVGVSVHGCKIEIKTSKPKDRKIIKTYDTTDIFNQFCTIGS
jgi:hypothetical protein